MTTPLLTAEQAAEVMLLAYAYRHGATSDALEAHLRSLIAPEPQPWLPAVPVHPEPMVMAWSNLERQRIEEYGRECFASGVASVKPFDPEALIRAVLPGGHSCDPQAVADDIREWARAHGIDAARLREALEKIAGMNGSIPAIVSVARAALAESATTGKEPGNGIR